MANKKTSSGTGTTSGKKPKKKPNKGGAGTSTYSPDKLNITLKGRKTTMPPLTGPPDPERPPDGPPAQPFQDLLKALLAMDRGPLHLIGFVTPQQAAEDRSIWFAEAPEYVERVALMMDSAGSVLPPVPWKGGNLLARLDRIKAGLRWMDEQMAFMRYVGQTLRTEQADLIRMSDVVVTEADLVILRPTLDDQQRSGLMLLADFPLRVWKERQAGIQQTKEENKQTSDYISEIENELDGMKDQSPPVTVPMGVPPLAPVPPADDPSRHPPRRGLVHPTGTSPNRDAKPRG